MRCRQNGRDFSKDLPSSSNPAAEGGRSVGDYEDMAIMNAFALNIYGIVTVDVTTSVNDRDLTLSSDAI